ncbi:MAG: nicotinate-nucleotide adenylyltransferase [Lachnospiraceae bacterium]|nr:nicotinate-nucleotide adenylyltransferase [Lachnospiraceae bacterium]
MNSKKKIGIMGGTFDPIHNAHLALAQAAYEQLGLDYVLFIPACQPPHKDSVEVSDADTRANMVKLAIADNPNFVFSDIELKRTGNSYTVDTLTQLKELDKDADYYFILGADSLFSIKKWYKPDEIMSKAVLAVGTRNNKTIEEMRACIDDLKATFNADIRLLDFPDLDISSTELRNIRGEGHSIKYLVPENVCDFITDSKLYLKLKKSRKAKKSYDN